MKIRAIDVISDKKVTDSTDSVTNWMSMQGLKIYNRNENDAQVNVLFRNEDGSEHALVEYIKRGPTLLTANSALASKLAGDLNKKLYLDFSREPKIGDKSYHVYWLK